jgi:hypothetical protein
VETIVSTGRPRWESIMSVFGDIFGLAEKSALAHPPANKLWDGHPWEWLFRLSPKSRGVVFGENFSRLVFESLGFVVTTGGDGHDLVVNTTPVEVKLKMVSGVVSRIREHGYDYMAIFALHPLIELCQCWFVPRSVIWGNSTPAKKTKTEERHLTLNIEHPSDYLAAWGGHEDLFKMVVSRELSTTLEEP